MLKQLSKTFPDLYLKTLRNLYSNTFNNNLQKNIIYLLTQCGSITPEEKKEQEDILCVKLFDIQTSLVILFNNLDELEQVEMVENNPYTGTRIVNIGIMSIMNFNYF